MGELNWSDAHPSVRCCPECMRDFLGGLGRTRCRVCATAARKQRNADEQPFSAVFVESESDDSAAE